MNLVSVINEENPPRLIFRPTIYSRVNRILPKLCNCSLSVFENYTTLSVLPNSYKGSSSLTSLSLMSLQVGPGHPGYCYYYCSGNCNHPCNEAGCTGLFCLRSM